MLDVSDLRVQFRSRGRVVNAVQGVSFTVEPGRTLAIIGESGSGKTVSAYAVLGLLPRTAQVSGSIRFDGIELVGCREKDLRDHRGRNAAMVFQDPERSLNPTMRIGTQKLRADLGLSYLFIAHDLALVKQVSDRVAVMYLGRLCEIGPVRDIYREPLHPYTLALLNSIPSPDPSVAKRDTGRVISGELPSPLDPPKRLPVPHPLPEGGGTLRGRGAATARAR